MDNLNQSSEDNFSINTDNTSTNVNGFNINSKNLSPEQRQMISDKLSKLQNNPMISMFLGGNEGISKIMQQLNLNNSSSSFKTIIDQTTPSPEIQSNQTFSNSNSSFNNLNSQTPSSPIPNLNSNYNNNVYSNPTFNPDVQHDSNRNIFIIVVILGAIFYLVYTYVWHGQIPL